MVEFLLVVSGGAQMLCVASESYPRYHRLLTLILRHETASGSTLICGKLPHQLQAAMRGRMSLRGNRGRIPVMGAAPK